MLYDSDVLNVDTQGLKYIHVRVSIVGIMPNQKGVKWICHLKEVLCSEASCIATWRRTKHPSSNLSNGADRAETFELLLCCTCHK